MLRFNLHNWFTKCCCLYLPIHIKYYTGLLTLYLAEELYGSHTVMLVINYLCAIFLSLPSQLPLFHHMKHLANSMVHFFGENCLVSSTVGSSKWCFNALSPSFLAVCIHKPQEWNKWGFVPLKVTADCTCGICWWSLRKMEAGLGFDVYMKHKRRNAALLLKQDVT